MILSEGKCEFYSFKELYIIYNMISYLQNLIFPWFCSNHCSAYSIFIASWRLCSPLEVLFVPTLCSFIVHPVVVYFFHTNICF